MIHHHGSQELTFAIYVLAYLFLLSLLIGRAGWRMFFRGAHLWIAYQIREFLLIPEELSDISEEFEDRLSTEISDLKHDLEHQIDNVHSQLPDYDES